MRWWQSVNTKTRCLGDIKWRRDELTSTHIHQRSDDPCTLSFHTNSGVIVNATCTKWQTRLIISSLDTFGPAHHFKIETNRLEKKMYLKDSPSNRTDVGWEIYTRKVFKALHYQLQKQKCYIIWVQILSYVPCIIKELLFRMLLS